MNTPAPNPPIAVLLVEPMDQVADALTRWLSTRPGLRCVGRVRSLSMIPRAVDAHSPDVVLIDMDAAPHTVIDAVRLLYADRDGPVAVVLAAWPTPAQVYSVIDAGAGGFATKDDEPTEIARVMIRAAAEEVAFSKGVLDLLNTHAGIEHKTEGVLKEKTPAPRPSPEKGLPS